MAMTLSETSQPASQRPIATATGSAVSAIGISITMADSLESARTDWLQLEAADDIVGSPYQRFAWVSAYAYHVAEPAGASVRAVFLRGPGGEPLAVFPIETRTQWGVRVARFCGGKHANTHLPLIRRYVLQSLDQAAGAHILREIATAAGDISLFALTSQPITWAGHANPFVAAHARPSPSNASEMRLGPDGEAVLAAHVSKDSRKKLRKKATALSALGPVVWRHASTSQDKADVFAAFLRQKAERFAELGIPNPFAQHDIQAFLRAMADDPQGGLELHALWSGDNIVATYGFAAGVGRLSGMFNSFDASPAVARCSPGELLLQRVIVDACQRGFHVLDLGVGEARYKDAYCTVATPLVDGFTPICLQGKALAAALSLKQDVKARIKRSPALMGLVKRLRRRIGG